MTTMTLSICLNLKSKFDLPYETFQDLLQEAELVVLQKKLAICNSDKLRPFTHRLIRNHLLDYIRKHVLRHPITTELTPDLLAKDDLDTSELRLSLSLLNKNERWLIDQKYLKMKTYVEIANDTETAPRTIRRRIEEIVEKLRES